MAYSYKITDTDDRQHVFEAVAAPVRVVDIADGRWVDLYALLQIDRAADERDINDAIVSRTADCLMFAFSRGGNKPEYIQQLEAHQPEYRAILLDANTRRRYDTLLAVHEAGDRYAIDYRRFLETVKFREQSGCLTAIMSVACFIVLVVLFKR